MSSKYSEFDHIEDQEQDPNTTTNFKEDGTDSMNEDKNFELQEIKNLLGNMATSDMEFRANMQTVIGDLARDQKADHEALRQFREEVHNHFDNEFVDPAQRRMIRMTVQKRVLKLLKIPSKKKERNYDEKVRLKKYGPIFYKRCYIETSWLGHLGCPYDTTKKVNYDSAIEDIQAWVPSNGVSGLMEEKDEMDLIDRDAS